MNSIITNITNDELLPEAFRTSMGDYVEFMTRQPEVHAQKMFGMVQRGGKVVAIKCEKTIWFRTSIFWPITYCLHCMFPNMCEGLGRRTSGDIQRRSITKEARITRGGGTDREKCV